MFFKGPNFIKLRGQSTVQGKFTLLIQVNYFLESYCIRSSGIKREFPTAPQRLSTPCQCHPWNRVMKWLSRKNPGLFHLGRVFINITQEISNHPASSQWSKSICILDTHPSCPINTKIVKHKTSLLLVQQRSSEKRLS